MFLLYCIGVYTAREQGIMRYNQYFCRFWKHHYFDWALLFRRGFKYAGIGGIISGTMIFGDWYLSFCLMRGKWTNYIKKRSTMPGDAEYSEFLKIY